MSGEAVQFPEQLLDSEPARWSLVDAGILYAVAQLGTWAVLFAVAGLFVGAGVGDAQLPEPLLIAGVLLVPALLAAGTVWIVRRQGGEAFLRRGLRRWTPRLLLTGAGVGLATKFSSDIILLLQSLAGFEPRTNNPLLQFPELAFTGPQLVILAVALVLVVPVAEELFFRAYVYRVLRARSGRATAIILSGLIFGLAHMNLTLVLPLTLAGVVFAVLYEWTGSLVAPMVAHGVMNGIAVAATFFFLQNGLPI